MANTKLTRILSIDGGGIRGIIPGQILVALEEKLKILDNNPEAKIADYFDLIAGTSTGGILTCIYLCPDKENPGRPRFSASEAVDLYLAKGNKIFDVSLWQKIKTAGGILDEKYSAKELEKALKEYLGNLKLSELLKPCLVTSYDIDGRQGKFFTQHTANKKAENFYVRDVARATSAAPTYFEVAHPKSFANKFFPLIDGGVFVNNPTLCAYAEARKLKFDDDRIKPTAKEMAILSIGTGNIDDSYAYNKAKDWGMVEWLKPLIDIMMSGVAETVDYQLKQIYDAVGAKDQYVRFNPGLHNAKPSMDDASVENLLALKEAGSLNAKDNDKELDEFAKLLIANK
jgi:patatin-like phospholipase/acyl hydrolase